MDMICYLRVNLCDVLATRRFEGSLGYSALGWCSDTFRRELSIRFFLKSARILTLVAVFLVCWVFMCLH